MSEWLADIESSDGAVASVEQQERFAMCLDGIRGMTGAATGLDRPSGRISATFALTAGSAVEAADRGAAIFAGAIAAARPDGEPSRITVERLPQPEPVPA